MMYRVLVMQVRVLLVPLSLWPYGVIGSHDWFRSNCRKAWGFKSLYGHQLQTWVHVNKVNKEACTSISSKLLAAHRLISVAFSLETDKGDGSIF